MMLKLRDVLYEEYENKISKEDKEQKLTKLNEPSDAVDFVEFLWLDGDENGWTWGRNGMTYAAYIHGPARGYFRQYF